MSLNPAAKSLNLHVAREIKAEMARQDLSQSELGHLLGISQRVVSSRLRGETEFTLGDVDIILRALGIPLEQLLPEGFATTPRRRRAS
jgi:transcriptional regulator with XRE-family HTH domain